MSDPEKIGLSDLIRAKAGELGFDICGIAKARILEERIPVLRKWCGDGMNDRMSYLERDIEKRADPSSLFPGVRSLVVTGFGYYSELKQKDPRAPVLSRYAYGNNYHDVISSRLGKLLVYIKSVSQECEGRIYVDSGPVMEKGWAMEAGLGWQGKHSVVINRETGSFFFTGILLLNIDLEYDRPVTNDHCGECRLCLDHCPTGAINDNRTIDARKCIANLTIENRGPIPDELIPKLGGRVYGCDKCQEVCPWNRNVVPDRHPEFKLNPEIAEMSREDWINLTEDQFRRLFRGTAVDRVKFSDLKRNIDCAVRSMEDCHPDSRSRLPGTG